MQGFAQAGAFGATMDWDSGFVPLLRLSFNHTWQHMSKVAPPIPVFNVFVFC